eukprot:TRINITY_DN5931_c0_g2_i1.p1 TRINITY_DN5931_c0_g2~~TRINITY_DN5931_c0_g2_i1.p1  ORF type:complete len:233 (-),score=67.77 TRINITY_DN5931_c0_g2_i1:118-759(-)
MASFSAAPLGFLKANQLINSLHQSLLKKILDDVLDMLYHKLGSAKASNYTELIAHYQSTLTQTQLQSIINAIFFIYRIVIQQKLSDVSETLRRETVLEADAVQLFQQAWAAHSTEGVLTALSSGSEAKHEEKSGAAALQQTLQLGRVLSLDWKLGVAVASADCAVLHAPFVTILLKVADTNGEVTSHCFDLSLPQFQDFARNFHDIAARLDTV